MRHFRTCGSIVATLVVLGATGIVPHARADERTISFTSFLREGPGMRYRVVDEVVTGEAVDVAECADGWCRLLLNRSTGFVPQAVLAASREKRMRADATCFLNRGNGARGGTPEQFCYDASSKR